MSLEAVKTLVAAPGVLDLFLWLSYRCFTAKGHEAIPLFGPAGLTRQLGCVDYSRPRRFRAMLEQWLGAIRTVWPECPAVVDSSGECLLIGHGLAVTPTLTADLKKGQFVAIVQNEVQGRG